MSLVPRSIRSRLALGYAAAVAVTVLVYAGVVYGFTRSALIDRLDAALRDDFERAEHAFEIDVTGALSWKEPERLGHHDTAEAPWTQVLHPKGGPGLLRPSNADVGDASYRVFEEDYLIAGETYRIRVGRSMAPMEAELSGLRTLLALCLLPVVGFAWLGGLLLARRALQPVQDMTERARHIGAERLSERLPVANPDDELGRLATVFNAAFERIEAGFERLRGFTSDAAHELRTPLAALRTVGEVGLGSSQDVEAHREVIASMLEETARLTRLVDELLELSRGDARMAGIEKAPVDLAELSRSVCEQLEVLASERGQELVVEGGGATVPGDANMLRRAVTNLVDNAIRHGPTSSTVRVRVEEAAAEAVIVVADEGTPIPANHRERIFDRLYRIDAARAGAGTGLGLSLAAQAIELHGGRIEIEARAEGNAFRVTLPRGG